MSIKDHFEDNRLRHESKMSDMFINLVVVFVASLLVSYLIPDRYKYAMIFSMYGILYVWWNGVPSFFVYLYNKIKLDSLYKIVFSKSFQKDNKFRIYRIQKGKKHFLNEFFFQKIVKVDGLKRTSKPTFIYSKRRSYHNLFDFKDDDFYTEAVHPKSGNVIKYRHTATEMITSLFRDSTYERIIKNIEKNKSNPKILEKYERLRAYKERTMFTLKKPSQQQNDLFYDLFSVIDGMLDSYEGVKAKKENRIVSKVIKSPLSFKKLKDRKGNIVYKNIKVNEQVVAFKDGVVFFSIDMIMDTVEGLSKLFNEYLKKRMKISDDVFIEENYSKIGNIFRFVIFRRFVMEYGTIPSSWVVVRVHDYSFRAIISIIDREMETVITSANDGSSDDFQSDVFAVSFVRLYWNFFNEKKIRPTMDSLKWSFLIVKEPDDINLRNDFMENELKRKYVRGVLMEEENHTEEKTKTKTK